MGKILAVLVTFGIAVGVTAVLLGIYCDDEFPVGWQGNVIISALSFAGLGIIIGMFAFLYPSGRRN